MELSNTLWPILIWLWIPTVWVRFSPLIFGLHPCCGVGMVCWWLASWLLLNAVWYAAIHSFVYYASRSWLEFWFAREWPGWSSVLPCFLHAMLAEAWSLAPCWVSTLIASSYYCWNGLDWCSPPWVEASFACFPCDCLLDMSLDHHSGAIAALCRIFCP
jgi:hypothetical protein